jgi:hypothetical protein
VVLERLAAAGLDSRRDGEAMKAPFKTPVEVWADEDGSFCILAEDGRAVEAIEKEHLAFVTTAINNHERMLNLIQNAVDLVVLIAHTNQLSPSTNKVVDVFIATGRELLAIAKGSKP